ncbi:tRNA (adenosine(37)-N6)-dimethylallyltransferase MiaA [Mesotoga sp. UBA5847]|jgi:tRNA dimethylallyltransferase|uniref:tRNA (adenosine(37)-N6)-dimethylallyltransferase MiaA n=1 Tax=Mesotoga sp. UBA5847 TaxID=1946859 RepID=UPI000ABCB8D5|nr:tRNA (adenosine(37)-N6)-dimethylallyltransferase MiaA [Mesotoga sp. UBA5847]
MIPILLGPTAVGKTSLLLDLAQRLPIEIVSVDSRQIYRFMNIGTAKPTESEQAVLKHWLIDIRDPDEDFDVMEFRNLALESVADITARGKIPILAGGTGLYAEVLMKGLVDVPPRDETVREALLQIESENKGSLRKILERVDKNAFERFHENDLKRTIRYLEVFFKMGRPLTELQNERDHNREFFLVILERDRSELHARIESRLHEMIRAGLADETESLLSKGYGPELNAFKTIGYAEMVQYVRCGVSLSDTIERILVNTRRYARRQIMWFRRYSEALRIDLSSLEGEAARVLENAILSVWGGKNG